MDELGRLQKMWDAMNMFSPVFIHPVTGLFDPIASDVLNPHYSDHRFLHGVHTVFVRGGYTLSESEIHSGGIVEGANYVYSDRMYNRIAWDETLAEEPRTNIAAFMQTYLQKAMKEPGLTLVHVLTGVNISNGHPYRVYGFIINDTQAGPEQGGE